MPRLKDIFREDIPDLLPSVIQKAKEGILEAQYLCWETFRWHSSNPTFPCDPLLFEYVAPTLSKLYVENVKIESCLPFYKERKKFKKELDRLKYGAVFIQTLEDIKREKNCTVEKAEEFLVKIAMSNCSSNEIKDPYTKAFLRINSKTKLKDEIRYYFRNYNKWKFYLESLSIMGLPFTRSSNHKIPN